jgi:crotonobetainyl-CoA:carnitine CoA-transferase CaiB-like acyl-CoA transferase
MASYLIGPAFVDFRANGREPLAAGTRDAFSDPVPNDVVRCADGAWLAVTARENADWARLSPILGATEGMATAEQRREQRVAVRALLSTWAATRTADDAAECLQAAGVPASKVQDASHLTGEDPQLAHRGSFLDLPSEMFGTQHIEGFPARLHDTSGAPIELEYRATPYYGEHTFDVYREVLGLDEIEIAERMGDGLFT